jgi:outer membrane receptor for ferrienterochelin and colicins
METKMTQRRFLFLALIIVTWCLAYSLPVCAQSVDYGSLEALFGEPITTSATGTPQRASEVATNMTIITADEIRQSGSRSVAEILSRVPGLDILRTSSTDYDVGVRGYQQSFQPRLLVLIDGRQVFLDGFSRTSWDNMPINVDDIRQIEVVKGASSALFGSNAVGGVVNIITYSPLYDSNNVASLTAGTQATFAGEATTTVKVGDRGGVKVSAGGSGSDEFNVDRPANEAQIKKDPLKRYAYEQSLFQLAPHVQTNFDMTYSYDRAMTGNIQGLDTLNNTTTFSVRGGAIWDSPYGSIRSDTYWNHLRLEPHPPGGGTCTCFSNDLISSSLEDQFKADTDNTFRVQLLYRHRSTAIDTSPVFAQAPAQQEDIGTIDGTWLWQINNKLSWTNAARFDHQTLDETGTLASGPFFSGADYSHILNTYSDNSGLVYQYTDKDTFRLIYGRGVQVPGVLEYGFNNTVRSGGTVLDIEGNPRLKPTIVTNYEMDYDRALPEILSVAKFAGFYEVNRDVKAAFQTIGTRQMQGTTVVLQEDLNVGDSRGYGGEFELKGSHPDGYRWDFSYSYARAYDDQSLTNATNPGGYDGSTPRHHFRMIGGYTTGPWEFDADEQVLTSLRLFRSGSDQTTGGYNSLSGRIGYKINDNLTASISGTNLTSTLTQESPFPAIERQVFFTLTGRL